LPLRDSPFEVAIVEWVIFDLDGEALVVGIDRRTLGDGPRFEYAIELKTEIIVKASGRVFLNYEAWTSEAATPFSPLGSAVLLKSRLAWYGESFPFAAMEIIAPPD